MIDVNKIRGRIREKGFTNKDVADALGIAEATFYSKMKRGVFDSDEIEIMISLLDIEDPREFFSLTCHISRDKSEVKQMKLKSVIAKRPQRIVVRVPGRMPEPVQAPKSVQTSEPAQEPVRADLIAAAKIVASCPKSRLDTVLYDYATKQKWITYPLGWAFYKTWIEVDEMRYKKHDKHTD